VANPLVPELAELEVSLGLVHHDPARFAEARRLLERVTAPDPRTRFLLALSRDLAGMAEQPVPKVSVKA
jgi:hypothetical protein